MIRTITKTGALLAVAFATNLANAQNPVITAPSGGIICPGTTLNLSVNDFLNKGLVAYYPFNGNANDMSGNSHDATTVGVALAPDRFGNANRSYLFAGTSTYVQCPSATYFNGDFTISGWVNVQTAESWSRLIDFGNGSGSDNVLVALSVGNTQYLGTSVFNGGSGSDVQSAQMLNLNQWVQITVTLQGTTRSVYYNGVFIDQATGSFVPNNVVRNINYIGLSNWGGDGGVFGSMDDIRIYDRSLSATEVTQLFNYENTEEAETSYSWSDGSTGSFIAPAPLVSTIYSVKQMRDGDTTTASASVVIGVADQGSTANPASGVCSVNSSVSTTSSETGVLYYLRDDLNNSIVDGPVEGTGSAISFTTERVTTTTTYNILAAKASGGLNFDGNDYVVIPDATGINSQFAGNHITVEGWYYPVSANGSPMLIGESYLGDNTVKFSMYLNGTSLSAGFYDGGWHQVNTTVEFNKWQHIACTYDQSELKLYINGKLITSAAETAALPSGSEEWRIGLRWDLPEYYGGRMDEVRIWNEARTQADIQNNMNSCLTGTETNLVAYYNFEDGTGSSTLTDVAGGDINGTLQNFDVSTAWVYGKEICSTCSQEMSSKPTVTINPPAQQAVSPANTNVICSGSATINVAGSESGVNYYLRDNSNDSVIAGPVEGTGSAISFNSGTVSANTTFNVFAQGVSGGLNFDGNDDWVSFSPDAALELDSGTIEAWIKTTDAGSSYRGIVLKNSAYGLFLRDNELIAFDWTVGEITTGIYPNDDKWHHVAMSFNNGISNGSVMYYDGLPVRTFTYNIFDQSQPLVLGAGGNSAFQNFMGSMDEVRVWNTVRTASEIKNNTAACLAGNETGLVVYCKFEEGTNSQVVNDMAGGDNNGTLQNFDVSTAWGYGVENCSTCALEMTIKPTVTVDQLQDINPSVSASTICVGGSTTVSLSTSQTGVLYWLRKDVNDSIIDGPVVGNGSALTFTTDSVNVSTTYNVYSEKKSGDLAFSNDDYVALDGTGLPSGNSNYTLEAWIKPGAVNGDGIVGYGNYGNVNEVNALRFNGAGQLHNYWWNNDLTVNIPNIFDGKYHHVAATFDGVTRSIYVDGALMGSDNPSGANFGTANAAVGVTNFSEYFNGSMSEVSVWNVARTQQELSGAMNTLTGTETGLVVYYTFDNGFGSTVTDLAGGDNNGTLTNMDTVFSWLASCQQEMTVTPTVIISQPTSSIVNQTACGSYTLNSQTYTASGTFNQTLTNAAGCDSIITLNLTVNYPTDSTITATACGSYILNTQTYTATAVYTQTVTNAAGCDSVITLDLTVNNVDAGATASNETLTASANGAAYQWLDCDNGYAAINGETNQVFTATANGNYAVLVTENNCSDTSSCINVITLGVEGLSKQNGFAVYPNPSAADVSVEISVYVTQTAEISVINAAGQIVSSEQSVLTKGKNNTRLDMRPYARGVYYVKVTMKENVFIQKVVLN